MCCFVVNTNPSQQMSPVSSFSSVPPPHPHAQVSLRAITTLCESTRVAEFACKCLHVASLVYESHCCIHELSVIRLASHGMRAAFAYCIRFSYCATMCRMCAQAFACCTSCLRESGLHPRSLCNSTRVTCYARFPCILHSFLIMRNVVLCWRCL